MPLPSFTKRPVNAPDAPQTASRRYAQAMEVTGASRLVFISGQIPVDADGNLASDFESQARQTWANLEAQLRAADMTLDNLLKVTVFLTDYANRDVNAKVRWEVMGDRQTALSTIVTNVYDESWLIEIEAIAAA